MGERDLWVRPWANIGLIWIFRTAKLIISQIKQPPGYTEAVYKSLIGIFSTFIKLVFAYSLSPHSTIFAFNKIYFFKFNKTNVTIFKFHQFINHVTFNLTSNSSLQNIGKIKIEYCNFNIENF